MTIDFVYTQSNLSIIKYNVIMMYLKIQVGSKASLKLNNKPTVWKLDDTIEEAWAAATKDDDIIDSDLLLDEDDLKKPDEQSLRGIEPFFISFLCKFARSGCFSNNKLFTAVLSQSHRLEKFFVNYFNLPYINLVK